MFSNYGPPIAFAVSKKQAPEDDDRGGIFDDADEDECKVEAAHDDHRTTGAHENPHCKDAAHPVAVASESRTETDDLTCLSRKEMNQSRFPVGCHVLVAKGDNHKEITFGLGTVVQVSRDSQSTIVYLVQCQQPHSPLVCREEDLQYAPREKVYLTILTDNLPGTVVSSDHLEGPGLTSLLYVVQIQEGTDRSEYSHVLPNDLSYRRQQNKQSAKQGNASEQENNKTANPPVAKGESLPIPVTQVARALPIPVTQAARATIEPPLKCEQASVTVPHYHTQNPKHDAQLKQQGRNQYATATTSHTETTIKPESSPHSVPMETPTTRPSAISFAIPSGIKQPAPLSHGSTAISLSKSTGIKQPAPTSNGTAAIRLSKSAGIKRPAPTSTGATISVHKSSGTKQQPASVTNGSAISFVKATGITRPTPPSNGASSSQQPAMKQNPIKLSKVAAHHPRFCAASMAQKMSQVDVRQPNAKDAEMKEQRFRQRIGGQSRKATGRVPCQKQKQPASRKRQGQRNEQQPSQRRQRQHHQQQQQQQQQQQRRRRQQLQQLQQLQQQNANKKQREIPKLPVLTNPVSILVPGAARHQPSILETRKAGPTRTASTTSAVEAKAPR